MARYEWHGDVGPVHARLVLEPVDGRAEVTELVLSAPAGLSAVALRTIPLGRLRATALAELARREPALARTSAADAAAELVAGTGVTRPRAPLYGLDHWSDVARVYAEAVRAPTQAVARRFFVSRRVAARWVRRARDEGLLPEPLG